MLKQKNTKRDVETILTNEITGEYTWLDFKLEYKNNTEELIHDILCLSNARHDGTRYIVYGVKDSTWELKGLSNKLLSDSIYAIVNSQIWNQKPEILVDHISLGDLQFGYIAIANSPTKPHYLRRPYKKIPASAIYTRQGDTNTPYRSGTEAKSIEDGELETMFRER
ncbi:MAG: ATP-binding protein, partial [Candidatus Electrothrix sp. AR3]|nr:ATP-binding protein [Candidatus Electrothrix sp. AR3]